LGLTLPLYVSGPSSVGWWAMLITMLADITAFVCLVFGYFFFWTVHEEFPPRSGPVLAAFWPVVGGVLSLLGWLSLLFARRENRRDRRLGFYVGLGLSSLLSAAAAVALLLGPYQSGLDPTAHAYPATVWMLVAWAVLHLAIGLILQLFCAVARYAGRLTAEYDMDLQNTTLFWHFAFLTTAVTAAVIAGFPLLV
jgi:cytochrome c oxidase subunit I+III